jgi:class 3 adenylate cyclase
VKLESLLARFRAFGARPEDSAEARVRKFFLVASALMIIPAGLVWGAIYFLAGEPIAASIPWLYAALSLMSLSYFDRSADFGFFRRTQLLLILILPGLLHVALGGFRGSSAVIVWSVLAPFGALVFAGISSAARWLTAYLLLLAMTSLFAAEVRSVNNLPQWLIDAFFALNVGTLSLITFTLLAAFIGQRDTAMNLLGRERERSERLLLNILPAEIAERLKGGESLIADAHPAATILFADVVGFTSLSAALDPKAMVRLLNDVFTRFDEIAEKHGLEKIRTIGDNYMAVSGVPRPRPDHAQAAARMALDMLDYVRGFTGADGVTLQFRIGLNSGPLVAGVIGKRKFVFDIWGDPVNTASRMESHGTPGRIQVTDATHELIADEFECELRGTIDVRGKGTMRTWFLTRSKMPG